MLSTLNGVERTVSQFKKILDESGWAITYVHRGKGLKAKVVAIPA